VLHKAKREEIWATEKKTNAIEEKKSTENRKAIFAAPSRRDIAARTSRRPCHGGVIEIGTVSFYGWSVVGMLLQHEHQHWSFREKEIHIVQFSGDGEKLV
jgi:hypothetical protein